jgi:hypothetical protein
MGNTFYLESFVQLLYYFILFTDHHHPPPLDLHSERLSLHRAALPTFQPTTARARAATGGATSSATSRHATSTEGTALPRPQPHLPTATFLQGKDIKHVEQKSLCTKTDMRRQQIRAQI